MRAIVACGTVLLLASCSAESIAPNANPEPVATISDAVHSAGTAGFYFLPPMVGVPTTAGTPDLDIASLDPQVVICDLIHGESADCGGATAANATLSTTTSPAITVDAATGQYHVNWNTRGVAFDAGHTYRVHVRAGSPGARRELGFADVLLSENPGQAKNVATGDVIILNDGQTLPIKFRIEHGVMGSIIAEVTPTSVLAGEPASVTATVWDLHLAPLAGVTVTWNSTGVPLSLAPLSSLTNASGVATTGVTAGGTPGSATIVASAGGLSDGALLTVLDPAACIPAGSTTVISTPSTTSIGPLYVTNQDGNRVTAYASGANGNATPVVSIEGASTGLNVPRGIARDAAGYLYVANYGSDAVTVYAPGASGDAAPVRVIAGPNTQLNGLEGLAVDGAGRVYAANQTDHKILVFAAGASGDVAPARRITGSCTGLNRPMGLALDTSGRLYVANLGAYTAATSSVTVYDAGANGNAAPRATIAGGATSLYNPLGITVDPSGQIYVANYGNTDNGPSNFATAVTIYAAGANGNVAPTRKIIGTMAEPTGLAIDANGELYAVSFPFDFITVYAAGADGLATPLRSLSGPGTKLMRPAYVTF